MKSAAKASQSADVPGVQLRLPNCRAMSASMAWTSSRCSSVCMASPDLLVTSDGCRDTCELRAELGLIEPFRVWGVRSGAVALAKKGDKQAIACRVTGVRDQGDERLVSLEPEEV